MGASSHGNLRERRTISFLQVTFKMAFFARRIFDAGNQLFHGNVFDRKWGFKFVSEELNDWLHCFPKQGKFRVLLFNSVLYPIGRFNAKLIALWRFPYAIRQCH